MKREKSTIALFNFIAVRLTRKSEGLLIGLTIPASYRPSQTLKLSTILLVDLVCISPAESNLEVEHDSLLVCDLLEKEFQILGK